MQQLEVSRVDSPASARLHHAAPAVILGVLAAVIGFAGSWIPSYWGDEAASVLSASRPLSSLANELSAVDAVHGTYYVFLHVWVDLFGTSELATRLPSAIAVGLMVAGTVVLVRGFAGIRMSILAGIVCTVLPRSTYMATEARSYAMASAAAVWLTVLLVHALRGGGRGARWWWVGYAVAMAASVYLFLYLGLVFVAHGVFVAVLHRRMLARWALAGALSLILAIPIVLAAYRQRKQIAFLARRDYATAEHVLIGQWFGWPVVAVLSWGLILVAIAVQVHAVIRRDQHADARSALTLLAVIWLVLPTTLILLGNAYVTPTYNVRYLSLSTPAAAILVALGISAIAKRVAPARRPAVVVGVAAALVAASVPVYIGQRTEWAKDGGSDLRAVASFVGDHADGDDAVVFDQLTKPSRDPRLALDLYPSDFTHVADVALVTPFSKHTGLWDRVTPNRDTVGRIDRFEDVWAVELPTGSGVPADISLLNAMGYEVESASRIHRTVVYHLVKN